MFSSNQYFKVSGEGAEELKQTLSLLYALAECGKFKGAPTSYEITTRGIVFYEYGDKGINFISPPSVDTLTNIVMDFLEQFDYDSTTFLAADKFYDGDGSHHKGWIVTCDSQNLGGYDKYFAIFAHWRYYAK